MPFYPKRAKYLLRFDDLCPAMNWDTWSEIEVTLVRKGIKPLLAVVPDNQDATLKVAFQPGTVRPPETVRVRLTIEPFNQIFEVTVRVTDSSK